MFTAVILACFLNQCMYLIDNTEYINKYECEAVLEEMSRVLVGMNMTVFEKSCYPSEPVFKAGIEVMKARFPTHPDF